MLSILDKGGTSLLKHTTEFSPRLSIIYPIQVSYTPLRKNRKLLSLKRVSKKKKTLVILLRIDQLGN